MTTPARLALILALALPAFAQEPTPAEPEKSIVFEATEAAMDAAIEQAAAVATPVEAPVVEETVVEEPVMTEAVEAAPVASGPVCCPINVVSVRKTIPARLFLRCNGPEIPQSICVDNPADCTCTLFEIPLCVPCCCTGAPQICPVPAILPGRGKVELRWSCGYVAIVTFVKHGGVIITYTAC